MEIFSGLQKVHSNDQEHDWRPCHTHRGGCIVLPGKKMLTFLSKSVFSVQETHGRALRAGNRLIANSQDAGWRSLHAAIIEEGPFTATEPAIGHPMLEQLAIAITTALRDGTAEDGLYIDTLAQMMAVHLARTHSAQSRPGRMPAMQAMSGWRMRRVIDYIEENLDGDLSLEA